MTKQVYWSKLIVETFLEESGLNARIELGDEKARRLEGILRTRAACWTIPKQAEYFHLSVDQVNKDVRYLKDLYDATQVNSVILPPRMNKSKWEIENEEKIDD